jgi:hypothetical protein
MLTEKHPGRDDEKKPDNDPGFHATSIHKDASLACLIYC